MRTTRSKTAALVGVCAAAMMLTAACSDSMAASDAVNSPEPSNTAMADNASLMSFGPGCVAVPKDGAGSFEGMSSDPVATAASNNPLLSTLVGAVSKAGLVDTLNSAEELTVFAPTNDAFGTVDKDTLAAVLADKKMLTSVLTYHVVAGQIPPSELAGTHKTLQGEDITVTGSGESFKVNGSANVICGDVRTANATVYIIDGVLTPKG